MNYNPSNDRPYMLDDLGNKRKTKQISLRLPARLYEALEKAAERNEMTVSESIRILIDIATLPSITSELFEQWYKDLEQKSNKQGNIYGNSNKVIAALLADYADYADYLNKEINAIEESLETMKANRSDVTKMMNAFVTYLKDSPFTEKE